MQGTISKYRGPLIVAGGMADVQMYDVVRVSDKHLIGEVIELRGDRASHTGLRKKRAAIGPGEPVVSTGAPLSVELAPGLIESIYDGIQRPSGTSCASRRATALRAASSSIRSTMKNSGTLSRSRRWATS